AGHDPVQGPPGKVAHDRRRVQDQAHPLGEVAAPGSRGRGRPAGGPGAGEGAPGGAPQSSDPPDITEYMRR
ncbi:hypothetical protein, partial [Nocardiopsis sp. NPDC055824]